MRIAIFADIHANREALTACLADAARRPVDRYVFLGDLVGYGADPEWVVDQVIQFTAKGAVAVRGNHDAAASGEPQAMNEVAQAAIRWTLPRLNATQRDFLAHLPLTIEEDERLFVHASAHEPGRWPYVLGAHQARESLFATAAQQTFCGHVHTPALYHMAEAGRAVHFAPTPGTRIPLGSRRCWLGIVGSVGQPRDGNPAACYALLEEPPAFLTFFRVPYDYETAARRMRQAGLPPGLSARLSKGI